MTFPIPLLRKTPFKLNGHNWIATITKSTLVSDIAKSTFDILGWFSPTIITMKILLQNLKIGCDDVVSGHVYNVWSQWRTEPHDQLLSGRHISRCYFLKHAQILSTQLYYVSSLLSSQTSTSNHGPTANRACYS